MHKISTRVAVANADLQIRGEGGGVIQPWDKGGRGRPSPKDFFRPYGPQFGLKTKGGVGPPGPLTWIRHLVVCVSSKHPSIFKYP